MVAHHCVDGRHGEHRSGNYLALAVAALNAASEEFQFRNLLLAHLWNVFRPAEMVLLTAAFFGLGHYYGQPSGVVGVAMAVFAGWILGPEHDRNTRLLLGVRHSHGAGHRHFHLPRARRRKVIDLPPGLNAPQAGASNPTP